MSSNNNESILVENIHRGKQKGIIRISDDNSKITYFCSREYTTSFKNPEEIVRASYFVELIDDYNYPKKNINIEHPVPRRTPEDRADIVVFEDEAIKKPYLVVECKKDGISDAEFKQAIEQVFGNANSLRAKFASVVAGTTRTAFDIAGFTPEEREKNVISDIPHRYGLTPRYRFIKGDKDKELKIVQKEDLIRTLEKAHDTVWQGGRLAPTTAFDEISKLLFCKLQDEKESSITKKGEPYKFQVGTYETDYYNLLTETNVKPRFEGKSNLLSNKEQKESYLRKRFENEFFHILFDQYKKLGELKTIKLEDLVSIAEGAKDFDEFRSQIIFRGILKEDYLDFINSIKADMEILEKVRNCFAHNRSPSEDDFINFGRVKVELLKKIDEFLAGLR